MKKLLTYFIQVAAAAGLLALLAISFREPQPTYEQLLDSYERELAALEGVEQLRRYWIDRDEFEMAHAEEDFARSRHLRVEQVKKNPTPEVAQGLEVWKERIRKHLRSRLAEIDEQKADQEKRVEEAKEALSQCQAEIW